MPLGSVQSSAVRPSDVKELLRRVTKRGYSEYLHSMKLVKLRAYRNAEIRFEFPVTALVGPNGGGKTTVLGAAAISSASVQPRAFFAKSGRYDRSMIDWRIEYEVVDQRATKRLIASYPSQKWDRSTTSRSTLRFGVARTLPATERKDLSNFIGGNFKGSLEEALEDGTVKAVEQILGKEAAHYLLISGAGKHKIYAAATSAQEHYSEFHFGAGEASVIRIVNEIERAEDNSLILIEEIENGLHPVAVRRMVEYLVRTARRKHCQVIFTTHSNEALGPLPDEAVWACADGVLTQGKLDVASLRNLTGQVEDTLSLFVEDEFAKELVLAALRVYSRREGFELAGLGVHAVGGEANVRRFTKSQNDNPAITTAALGFLDGDQATKAEPGHHIHTLPGDTSPEQHVYDAVLRDLVNTSPKVAIALGMTTTDQDRIVRVANDIYRRNNDLHRLYHELGDELEFQSAAKIRDVFLGRWAEDNQDEVDAIGQVVHARSTSVETS